MVAGSALGVHSCVPLVASDQRSSGMQFIAECGIEYGCQFVARLCRLPKQEPSFSSIPQTAFIQRKADKIQCQSECQGRIVLGDRRTSSVLRS